MDRAKTAGDAVTPEHGRAAELLYRACDLGTGIGEVTAQVAGEGVLEVSLNGGTRGPAPSGSGAGPFRAVGGVVPRLRGLP
ncbi:hypothetical protein [Streptomyces sp. NBC_00557]|uniref:hypothetical protein n=1 Tax=Streptomyces sp. NBC_00557 TaxID=2975776 RepID=UPI003FCC4353